MHSHPGLREEDESVDASVIEYMFDNIDGVAHVVGSNTVISHDYILSQQVDLCQVVSTDPPSEP